MAAAAAAVFMINYNSSSALKTFLEREELGMRKKFGQNFLINPSVRQTLADTLCVSDIISGEEVWEIGPGLGAMTVLLLEKGLKVRAFEIDKGFIRLLKDLFSDNKNFLLVEGDVMKTRAEQKEKARYLFGNLPYNIAAVLMAELIEDSCLFERMVITVQKETALRMAASSGSPDYSSLSVLCASVYRVKPLMTIKPSSFFPQPNVDSMGVLFENKNASCRPEVFTPLVRVLFSSRRKMIKNNLKNFIASMVPSAGGEICESLLRENALTGNERAENLEPEVFLSLAKSIENMRVYKKGCR
ncbi:MAG: 16S rRNA (adenine(1518)-N(6)/adenine(1519)-N(6))-dimethyltransferase RsmA [Treponema sp.]|nr:16S rRNA (adenine(1518)-N(6)/adenine(1519)-N(6))-dimethyltransferase RsmA [Treponema sp.]MCL2271428.1 16S rRNA (adenine(1518)-N(6)/adenine(1519)-N(6))-dimethyltransferase RsmA [Treponema sp.]